ncbi:MAG: phage holin family protein [Actinomycetota bacterium]|nr:phage holin family protein [Actinomycetota bacterium]
MSTEHDLRESAMTQGAPGAVSISSGMEGRDSSGTEPTLGALLSDMTTELSQLMRQEVSLAKAELKEEASKGAKGAGMLGAAAVTAYLALLMLSFAAAWALASVMPTGLAFLLMGLAFLAAAAVLGKQGKERMSKVSPVPEQTIETLKEDVQWAKAPTR